ncbi:MAG TPA: neutral/alkaline non-lysosomal ceramidase N-terminal domain-containing protein [Pirellulales bacterium]|jgi:hypothetical protein
MPHVELPQSRCRVGVGRSDITPPVGMYHRMWGAAAHERSTGIHRPLTATALALSPLDESDSVASRQVQLIVGIDHCLMWRPELDALRATVAQRLELAVAQVHISFSHTHAAGLMDPARRDRPGGELIEPYLQKLSEQIADAAQHAVAIRQSGSVMYGTGRSSLARNRDFWDAASRQFVCGLNPAGPADDTVMVARAANDEGQLLATIVNYACHPTTLAWDNTLVSPDYVGAMRETVEATTGAPCLFLQGASGDLGPRHGFVGDTAVADQHGRELGYAALAALESLPAAGKRLEYRGPVVSGATIGVWDYAPLEPAQEAASQRFSAESFSIPLARRDDLPSVETCQVELARLDAAIEQARGREDTEKSRDLGAHAERLRRQISRMRSLVSEDGLALAATLLNLGGATWVFVAAEHYQQLQVELRARFADRPLVIATLTDGWEPGYLPTAETYGRGIYQESIALAAAGSLEEVIQQIAARISGSLAAGG